MRRLELKYVLQNVRGRNGIWRLQANMEGYRSTDSKVDVVIVVSSHTYTYGSGIKHNNCNQIASDMDFRKIIYNLVKYLFLIIGSTL